MDLRFVPDLRNDSEQVTIEHVSVLQERLAAVLDEAYPDEGVARIVTQHFDPEAMKEEILEIFTPAAFLTLFKTEMGKGVLIGAFYQAFIDAPNREEDDEA
jgi:hypothetical protein